MDPIGCLDVKIPTHGDSIYIQEKSMFYIYIYIYSVYSYIFYDMFPFGPPKNHGWLGYIGDYAILFFRDYNRKIPKNPIRRIPNTSYIILIYNPIASYVGILSKPF